MDITEGLLEYGLEEKEIKCYISILKSGKTTAHEISKNTDIIRQTCYDTLSKLQQKGLVSQIIENKKTYFLIENPENLIKSLKEKEDNINLILPELKAISNSSEKETKAKQYTGLKGIKAIYEDFLLSKTPIKTIQPDLPEKILREYFIENFSLKRADKKIPIRILKEEMINEFQERITTEKKKFREVRLLKSLDKIKTHIVIYGEKVAFLNYGGEPTGIIIEDKSIQESQENLFDILWTKSKEI